MSKFRKYLLVSSIALLSVFASVLQPLPANAAVPACSQPTISGNARVGATLSTIPSCSNTPTSYTYQWASSATSNGTYAAISGATASTFVVTRNEAGMFVKVTITAVNGSGNSIAVSAATGAGPMLFSVEAFVGTASAGTADGVGTAATFTNITAIASDGTYMYVADGPSHRIRRVSADGTVTTIAGNGTAAIIDGIGTAASFSSPNGIAYNPSTNSIFIQDQAILREMDLTSGRVTTLVNEVTVLSASRSSTTVTLNFAQAHGFYYNQTITVAGMGAPYDGTFTITNAPSVTSLQYTVGTSATVSTFNAPVGSKITGDLGLSRTSNIMSHFYEAFQVSPDGSLYIGRTNAGEGNSMSRLLRFTRISGSTFRYDRLMNISIAPCALAFKSSTELFVNTCGSVIKMTTSDSWATWATSTISTGNVNDGIFYDPAGYVFYSSSRYDVNTGVTSAALAYSGLSTNGVWEMLGDTLFVADQYGTKILQYVGAASGSPLPKSVTYAVPGGVTAPTQVALLPADTFVVAAGPSRAGYSFVKWNDGSADYAAASTYTVGSSAVTLTAVWSALPTYAVSYAVPGGVTAPTQVALLPADTFVVAAGPSRAGYSFVKWNDGSADYAAASTYTVGSSAVTLTAVWSAISVSSVYSVTFDANGGSGTMTDQSDSAAAVLTTSILTKSGFTFAGWNDSASGTGTSYADGGLYPFASSITLYAQWQAVSQPSVPVQIVQPTPPTTVTTPTPAPPASPAPPAAPPVKVMSISVASGAKSGSSALKILLSASASNSAAPALNVVVKIYDFNGKLLQKIQVPVITDAASMEVPLTFKVGEFNAEVSTDHPDAAAPIYLTGGSLVKKSFIEKSANTNSPTLVGRQVGPSVYFAPNSAVLTSKAKAILRLLAAQLVAESKRIAITGFAAKWDQSKKFASALATRRAQVVGAFLISQGVRSWVYYAGYGTPLTLNPAAKARKVTVTALGS